MESNNKRQQFIAAFREAFTGKRAIATMVASALIGALIGVAIKTSRADAATAMAKPSKNCKVVVTKKEGKFVLTIHDHKMSGHLWATFEGTNKPGMFRDAKKFKLNNALIPYWSGMGGEMWSVYGTLNGVSCKPYLNFGV